MRIPRAWHKVEGNPEPSKKGSHAFRIWGWGDDAAEAQRRAEDRLRRLLARLTGGASPGEYAYADLPLREEILKELGPRALLTRNHYGSVVLNAAGLLVLDVDLPMQSLPGWIGRMLGKRDPADDALARLRTALREGAPASSFRLYRTAAGLRAIALDREFDPTSEEVSTLMQHTRTDPAFAVLCKKQQSFRARLTPKPYRCGCPNPPGAHPREGAALERFTDWCERYARAAEGHATCRYVETVGEKAPIPALAPLVDVHDQVTRCAKDLPLA